MTPTQDTAPRLPLTEAQAAQQRKRLLLEKVRVLEDRTRRIENLLRGADPAFAYVWVFNDQHRIDYYKSMEYQVVGKTDKVDTDYKRPDGTHVRGDTILMKTPRELFEAWKALPELKQLEQMEGKSRGFSDWASSNGVPIVG